MKYFSLTSKLLSQETFLKCIGQLYEDFIDLEPNALFNVASMGETFQISINRWERLSQSKEPMRFFSGVCGSFLFYVKEQIEMMIYNDLNEAKSKFPVKEKERENCLRNLLQEAEIIKVAFADRDYLKPLARKIIQTIDSILIENQHTTTNINPIIDGKEMEIQPMQWNANLNVLTTIFYDLTKKQISNKRMALDATPEQIKAFLSMWFVDKDGKELSPATLNTYFQEDKPEKKATKRKHTIDKYLEGE